MEKYQKYLPHAVAVLLFIVLTAVFFKPLVFDGKPIRQGDIQHHKGMSKEIVDFREKYNKEPLWTNSMFGGMPAYQISVLYPSNLVNSFQKLFSVIIPFPVTAIMLCMIGFYFLLLSMKVDPWPSIAGAIAFGLSSYFIILYPAGHNSKIYAIAYMAPVLMGVLLTFRGKLWLGAALTAISLALEINANHLQITYYLMMVVVLVSIGEVIRLVKEKQVPYLAKASGILAGAVVLSILPNIGNLLLTNEYGKYTTRGKSELTIDNTDHKKTEGLPIDYATQWSYGKGETMTLMIADFQGGASERIGNYDEKALDAADPRFRESIAQMGAYFGTQPFTSGPVYVGAIICFLFVLGLLIVRDPIKWWLLAATVLSVMLSWGKNFEGLTEFFFNTVPGYNKFRAVSMILVIAELTIPLLAMLTIKEILTNTGVVKEKIKMFYIAFALTGGLSLLVWLSPSTFVTTVSSDEANQISNSAVQQGLTKADAEEYVSNLEVTREAIVSSDAGRSFLFILLAAGILFLYIRKPFSKMALSGALIALMLFDMWGVAHRYMSDDNYERSKKKEAPYFASKADQMVLQDKDPAYRVMNLSVDMWQDASTAYFHKALGGYHGAKLKRIQELYEQVMEEQIRAVRSAMSMPGADSLIDVALSNAGTVNMFNTRYIIYNPDGGVLQNKFACGGAWFVKEVKMVDNADQEITTVKTIDPHTTAVVDKRYADQLTGFTPKFDSSATIKVVSHQADKIVYESNASSDQVALFPEVFYPAGWKVKVDGKESSYFCANYIIRGMKVPAGKHTIEFTFEPESYYTGEKVAMFGSIALFLFVAFGVFMEYRKNKKA